MYILVELDKENLDKLGILTDSDFTNVKNKDIGFVKPFYIKNLKKRYYAEIYIKKIFPDNYKYETDSTLLKTKSIFNVVNLLNQLTKGIRYEKRSNSKTKRNRKDMG